MHRKINASLATYLFLTSASDFERLSGENFDKAALATNKENEDIFTGRGEAFRSCAQQLHLVRVLLEE